MTLTSRGWVLTVASVLTAAAGGLFGVEELFPIAAAGAALLLGAAVATRARHWELHTERHLLSRRIASGSGARLDLSVLNPTGRRSPLLRIRDPWPGSTRCPILRVAPLEPGQRLSASFALPGLARGRYAIGPLEISHSDPFDLIRVTRPGAPASVLTVHPRLLPVVAAPFGDGSDDHGAPGPGAVGSSSEDFSSLRPYQEGDDLRQIHWASTARVDHIMVRQQEVVRHRRCTVAVDLRSSSWPVSDRRGWPTLDEALGAAGGVLAAARRSGGQIRLVTTAGLDTGYGSTVAHWGSALDALATVTTTKADPAAPLSALLSSGPRPATGSGTFTVITSSRVTEDDLTGLAAVAASTSLVVAVFDQPGTASGAGSGPTVGGTADGAGQLRGAGRLLRVARASDFPSAWARLMSAPARSGAP